MDNGTCFAWLLLALLMGTPVAAAQTSDSTPTTTTSSAGDGTGDAGNDGGPYGQADGPPMGGVIIGILFIGILALMFAAYWHYRD